MEVTQPSGSDAGHGVRPRVLPEQDLLPPPLVAVTPAAEVRQPSVWCWRTYLMLVYRAVAPDAAAHLPRPSSGSKALQADGNLQGHQCCAVHQASTWQCCNQKEQGRERAGCSKCCDAARRHRAAVCQLSAQRLHALVRAARRCLHEVGAQGVSGPACVHNCSAWRCRANSRAAAPAMISRWAQLCKDAAFRLVCTPKRRLLAKRNCQVGAERRRPGLQADATHARALRAAVYQRAIIRSTCMYHSQSLHSALRGCWDGRCSSVAASSAQNICRRALQQGGQMSGCTWWRRTG